MASPENITRSNDPPVSAQSTPRPVTMVTSDLSDPYSDVQRSQAVGGEPHPPYSAEYLLPGRVPPGFQVPAPPGNRRHPVGYQPPAAPAYRQPSSQSTAGYQGFRFKPPTFNGRSKWSTFIRQFEAIATGQGWTDDDKLVNMWAALADQAADYAFELEPAVLEDYESLVGQLERRFRVSQTRDASQRLFYARQLDAGEKIRAYAADLKALIHRAYPHGLTNDVREDMLIKQFFDGLKDDDAQYFVKHLRRPRSIDEAADLLIEYQSYKGGGRCGPAQVNSL